ncbi:MAG: hypothetical protein WKF50_07050 [Nocardioides sp.]
MDIQQELDRAIGHGPALPTPDQRLRAGRAAVLRRRAGIGAAAAATVAVLAVPAVLTLGGGSSSVAPAATPSSPSQAAQNAEGSWRRGAPPARYDADGNLVIRPGADVHERRDGVVANAFGSVALDLSFEGERTWLLVERQSNGDNLGLISGPGQDSDVYRTFDDFVVKGAFAMGQREPLTSAGGLVLELVDGQPQLSGVTVGMSIGPVVRGEERAFGYEITDEDSRDFLLLTQGPGVDTWRVERLEPSPPGIDLVAWLRGQGWAPTGEESSN